MSDISQPARIDPETRKPAAETLHLKKQLQTKELAWLRKLRDAQAKDQGQQL